MKKHFLALDAMRGIAALAVVFYHRRWWADGGLPLEHGHLAVEFFFILSGFVLAHAYEKRLATDLSFARFAQARLIRLGPMLLIGGIVGGAFILIKAALGRHAMDMATIVGLVTTLLALPTPFPMALLPDCPFPINPPTWSLFFEILVNLLFGVLAPTLRTRPLMLLIAASFTLEVAGAISSGTLHHMGNTYDQFWGGVPRTAFPFFFGVLLYRWHLQGLLPRFNVSWLALGAVLVATLMPSMSMRGNVAYELACVSVVYPAIIVLGLSSEPAPGWSRKLAHWSGVISYPAYILHYPLFYWLDPVGRKWPSAMTLTVVVAIITAISYIALRYVDEPIRRWATAKLKARNQGTAAAT